MVCYLVFGLIVTLIAVAIYFDYRKKQPKVVGLSEVPAMVRDEALRRVPGLQIERVLIKGGNYVFGGTAGGRPIDVEVKLRGEGDTQYVRKIEIQFETRHSHRNLYNKQPLELAQVPPHVVQAATQAVNQHAGSLNHFDRAKKGKVAGGNAYDLKGWSGQWEVEVELLASGELLELELKNKSGSSLTQPRGAPKQLAECTPADRESIYLAACIVALADGFKRSEHETLARIVRELQLSHDSARRIREAARDGSRKCRKPSKDAGRRLMLQYVLQVAAADGKLDEKEKRIVLRLGKSLGVDKATVLQELNKHVTTAREKGDSGEPVDRGAGASPPSPMAVLVSQLGEAGVEAGGPDSATSAGRAANATGERPPRKWALFWKNAWRPLLLVGVTYSVSAIALGWQFQAMPTADGFEENAFWTGFLLAGVGLLFTFTHGFVVGLLGLAIFRGSQRHKEKPNRNITAGSISAGSILGLGFLFIWFGGWFMGPIVVLSGITGGLSLAWFWVHLALTKPGWRMVAYIEHGSTSLALLFIGLVFATGNLLATAVLLVGQVFLLTVMEAFTHSGKTNGIRDGLKLENFGIKFDTNWRSIGDLILRGVFVVAAIGSVISHFYWRNTMEERQIIRAKDDAARRQLEVIGGRTVKEWTSKDGYTATLVKPAATDDDLAVLRSFVRIAELKLPGSSITDEGLKNLKHIKSIDSLDLSKTTVTDAGMAHLRNVEFREELNLSDTAVTDETLLNLTGLTYTKRMRLRGAGIKGPGLRRLAECKKLADLDLYGTPLFDDDVPFIEAIAEAIEHLRVRLMGTNVSMREQIRLNNLSHVTVEGIGRNQEDEDSGFQFLRLDIDGATAINDKYQVVGWTSGRAVLVKPHDSNDNGRPDTYLKDSDQNGVNDQLVPLGTFPGWDNNAKVTDINNRGQIVGYVVRRASPRNNWDFFHRGFVIDPLDTDQDGQPDRWFQDAGDGKTNLLMKDLGTFGGKRCEPSAINDAGQIVGWSDIGRVPRGFVIDPRDADGDGKLEWFQLGDAPRLNTLMVDITGSSDYAAGLPKNIDNRGQIVGKAHVYPAKGFPGQSFRLTPRQVGSQDELEWFIDSDGDGLNDLLVPLGDQSSAPGEAMADAPKTNSAGATIGTMSSGRRRATVMIPR